ncbi:MAG: hemolysin family protein [Candidatus Limnocylindria bacterium]
MDASILFGITAALALVLLNGFFVAAEFAIVKVRGTQLRTLLETGGATARMALHITRHLDAYLAACQVGITLASLGLGWIGEPAIASVLEPPLAALVGGFAPAAAHAIALTVAFAFIAALHVILGELAPKSLAIQKALVTTLWVVWPLHLFYRLMFPFIWVLNTAGNAVVRRFGLQPATESEYAHSPEELRMLVDASAEAGSLEQGERQIVSNALEFSDVLVRQVMTPRTEIVAVPASATVREALDLMTGEPHTGLPVYQGDLDHVVGILQLRDLVRALGDGKQDADVRSVMRPVVPVPEGVSLLRAIAEMRRHGASLLLAIDEFGGTAGLVTVGDVLQELVGDLEAGPGEARPRLRSEADGALVIDGLTPLVEAGERLGRDFEGEPYDTVGGLVFGHLGRLGAVGDRVNVNGIGFEVTAVDGRRIAEVRARRVVLPSVNSA